MQNCEIDDVSLHSSFYKMDQDPKFLEFLEYFKIRYRTYASDNLITFGRALSFLKDPKFTDALFHHPVQPIAEILTWRLHTACWAAKNALRLEGDFVECGVENAITATQIVNYLDFKNIAKTMYLYDTFAGIPEDYLEKHNLAQLDHYDSNANAAKNYAKICMRFKDHQNVQVIQGDLPAALIKQCPEKIAFLHLNLGNYPSEYDVLKLLLPKIVPGGIVLFQSFGIQYYGCFQIAKADCIVAKGLSILELPTGQGIMIV